MSKPALPNQNHSHSDSQDRFPRCQLAPRCLDRPGLGIHCLSDSESSQCEFWVLHPRNSFLLCPSPRPCFQGNTHTHTHTTYTHRYTQTHIDIHTQTQTNTHKDIHTHRETHTHTHTHTQILYTHTHTGTHTDMHTQRHSQVRVFEPSLQENPSSC